VKLDLKRNVGNDTQYLTFHLARQPIAKFPEPSIGAMPSTTPAGHANGQQRAQRLALGGGGGGGGGTGGGLQVYSDTEFTVPQPLTAQSKQDLRRTSVVLLFVLNQHVPVGIEDSIPNGTHSMGSGGPHCHSFHRLRRCLVGRTS
jgi:hypothetical protein